MADSEIGALNQQATRVAYFTVGWTTLEALVGLVAGLLVSSIALVGFGLDSLIEAASGLAILWRFKQRRIEEHEAEARATKLVGLTFFALAAYVGYEATASLWSRRAPEFSAAGMILAVVSLGVMPLLGIRKRNLARQLRSRALAADARETMFCAYFSGILLLGLGLNGWLKWWWADPVAALAMTGFMIREGIEAVSPDRKVAT